MDSRNFTYMFYGFAAVWVILCLYVIHMVFRERATRKQLESVRRMLEERETR
jgi:hypothetical protein